MIASATLINPIVQRAYGEPRSVTALPMRGIVQSTRATIAANDQQVLRQRSEQRQIWQAARQEQLRQAWLRRLGAKPA